MSGADFHHRRGVTARKPHGCFICGEPIPASAPYLRVTGVWEGDFFSGAHHFVCDSYVNDTLEPGDSYGWGDFSVRDVVEWLEQPKQADARAEARIYFSAHGSPRWREALGLEPAIAL